MKEHGALYTLVSGTLTAVHPERGMTGLAYSEVQAIEQCPDPLLCSCFNQEKLAQGGRLWGFGAVGLLDDKSESARVASSMSDLIGSNPEENNLDEPAARLGQSVCCWWSCCSQCPAIVRMALLSQKDSYAENHLRLQGQTKTWVGYSHATM